MTKPPKYKAVPGRLLIFPPVPLRLCCIDNDVYVMRGVGDGWVSKPGGIFKLPDKSEAICKLTSIWCD